MSEAQQQVRQLLTDMLAVVDSSPDALSEHYAALRDGSYELAVQVRTAATPDPWPCREKFITEVTARKW